jgi:hypothetical protein
MPRRSSITGSLSAEVVPADVKPRRNSVTGIVSSVVVPGDPKPRRNSFTGEAPVRPSSWLARTSFCIASVLMCTVIIGYARK